MKRKLNECTPTSVTSLTDLPSEMLILILDFIPDVYDGLSLVLTCKELFQTHYFRHDLFLHCRLSCDLARVTKKISIPSFKRRTPIYHQSPTFSLLLNEQLQDIKQSLKNTQNNLDIMFKKEEKINDWNIYLNEVEMEHGKDVASFFSTHVFAKTEILSYKVKRLDYRRMYEASVSIGGVRIDHFAYDEEGCATNWTLTMYLPTYSEEMSDEYEIHRFQFAEMTKGSRFTSRDPRLVMYNLTKVRKALGWSAQVIGEALASKITDMVLIDTIITILPWKKDWNCVYFERDNVTITEERTLLLF